MSEMKITGKLIAVMPTETGQKKDGSGEWQKCDVCIETFGEYPKNVAIVFLGKKVEQTENLEKGQELVIHYNLESRAYKDKNGKARFMTNVNGWKIETPQAAQANAQVQASSELPAPPPESDDLPF